MVKPPYEITETDRENLEHAERIYNMSCVNLWEPARETAMDSRMTADEIEEHLKCLVIAGIAACLDEEES